jgi:hypothetical protein
MDSFNCAAFPDGDAQAAARTEAKATAGQTFFAGGRMQTTDDNPAGVSHRSAGADPLCEAVTAGTTLDVDVREPSTKHSLTLQQVERWLSSPGPYRDGFQSSGYPSTRGNSWSQQYGVAHTKFHPLYTTL